MCRHHGVKGLLHSTVSSGTLHYQIIQWWWITCINGNISPKVEHFRANLSDCTFYGFSTKSAVSKVYQSAMCISFGVFSRSLLVPDHLLGNVQPSQNFRSPYINNSKVYAKSFHFASKTHVRAWLYIHCRICQVQAPNYKFPSYISR